MRRQSGFDPFRPLCYAQRAHVGHLFCSDGPDDQLVVLVVVYPNG
jgi:hypothetical protein